MGDQSRDIVVWAAQLGRQAVEEPGLVDDPGRNPEPASLLTGEREIAVSLLQALAVIEPPGRDLLRDNAGARRISAGLNSENLGHRNRIQAGLGPGDERFARYGE